MQDYDDNIMVTLALEVKIFEIFLSGQASFYLSRFNVKIISEKKKNSIFGQYEFVNFFPIENKK